MTLVELRDYIAIQAMTSMIGNDSSIVDQANLLLRDPHDDEAREAIDNLTAAAFTIANEMLARKQEVDELDAQEIRQHQESMRSSTTETEEP